MKQIKVKRKVIPKPHGPVGGRSMALSQKPAYTVRRRIRGHYLRPHCVSWYLAEGYGNGDQRPPTGPCSLRMTLRFNLFASLVLR